MRKENQVSTDLAQRWPQEAEKGFHGHGHRVLIEGPKNSVEPDRKCMAVSLGKR